MFSVIQPLNFSHSVQIPLTVGTTGVIWTPGGFSFTAPFALLPPSITIPTKLPEKNDKEMQTESQKEVNCNKSTEHLCSKCGGCHKKDYCVFSDDEESTSKETKLDQFAVLNGIRQLFRGVECSKEFFALARDTLVPWANTYLLNPFNDCTITLEREAGGRRILCLVQAIPEGSFHKEVLYKE